MNPPVEEERGNSHSVQVGRYQGATEEKVRLLDVPQCYFDSLIRAVQVDLTWV